MAAQEQVSNLRVCEKCFSVIGLEATFCPECGAPCGADSGYGEGSDAAIYPELARANLLRMRGDYKMAEDVCRAILRRYPNNTTAAGLLGDIAAETGQLEDAIRWYELVLDLAPDSPVEIAKLDGVHRRLKEQHALSTAEQLGLPVANPKVGLYAGLFLAFIAIVAFAAFLLGRKTGAPSAQSGNRVNVPYEAGTFDPRPVDTSGATSEAVQSPSAANLLVQQLRSQSALGSKILDAFIDPRTNRLSLEFSVTSEDDARYVAAHLARAAMGYSTNVSAVDLRATKDGIDVFYGEVSRSAMASALPTLGESPEADKTAFANAMLSNEWPTRQAPTTQPTEPEPAPSNTNSTSEAEGSSSSADSGSN